VLLAWRLPWLRSSLLLYTTSQEVLLFSEKERVVEGSCFFSGREVRFKCFLRFVCEGFCLFWGLLFSPFFFVFRFLHYLEAKYLSPRNLKVLCSLIFFSMHFLSICSYIYLLYFLIFFVF
jgi:hypothetical protein